MNNIPPKLKKLEPSYVARYWLTSELLKNLGYKPGMKILDVGGNGSLLNNFIPSKDIWMLDLPENKNKQYIKASALNMPLKDGSYDFVVSCDVYEHIPHKDREKFVYEKLRVARKAVILCAPFGSKEVAGAEVAANNYYKAITGVEHPWLTEHIDNILPDGRELESILSKQKLSFNKLSHEGVDSWSTIMRNHFISLTYGRETMRPYLESLYKFYYENCIFTDFGSNGYRTTYVISKSKSLRNMDWFELSKDDLSTTENYKLLSEFIASKVDQEILKVYAGLRASETRQSELEAKVGQIESEMEDQQGSRGNKPLRRLKKRSRAITRKLTEKEK